MTVNKILASVSMYWALLNVNVMKDTLVPERSAPILMNVKVAITFVTKMPIVSISLGLMGKGS